MFTRRLTSTALAAVAGFSLSQCMDVPPYPPPVSVTGISLDGGPNPRGRGGRGTRYLDSLPEMPLRTPPPPVNPGQFSYDTPESIDRDRPNPDRLDPVPDPGLTRDVPADSPPPPTIKPETPQLPFGVPVPGKRGFVYSPYDKEQMVDVTGIDSGKKVRCPYTSKIFLVP